MDHNMCHVVDGEGQGGERQVADGWCSGVDGGKCCVFLRVMLVWQSPAAASRPCKEAQRIFCCAPILDAI